MIAVVKVLTITLLASIAHGVSQYDTGAGIVFKLGVVQYVTVYSYNLKHLDYLIVSKHPGFPNKRSLVQFENLPSDCPSSEIKSAKMYLYYVYAHKSSGSSVTRVPFIPRPMQLHVVKKSWKEAEATSTRRDATNFWSTAYLGLNGTDAEEVPEPGTVTIFPYRPRGFVEFDVTNAVKRWRDGLPNNGLLIRATNELDVGRDIRFARNGMSAYILVSVAANFTNMSCSIQTSVKSSVSSSFQTSVEKSVSSSFPTLVESDGSSANQTPVKSSSGQFSLNRYFSLFPTIIICELVLIF